MRKNFTLLGAVVTCPCHVPILIVLLGGTTAGVFLAQHKIAVFLFASILFIVFVGLVVRGKFGSGTCSASAAAALESHGFGARGRSRTDPSTSSDVPVL